jgi:hypothetical protein
VAKYDAFTELLDSFPSHERLVTFRFDELAKVVGGLPDSAYEHRQWWSNDSKPQARAWRSAGWHVDSLGVDFNARTVRFARGRVGGTRARRLGQE